MPFFCIKNATNVKKLVKIYIFVVLTSVKFDTIFSVVSQNIKEYATQLPQG
jgi:hypothetical protein